MAQIHALTPEGRLPSAAVTHVEEVIADSPAVSARAMAAGEDWDSITTTQVATQNFNITDPAPVHAPGPGRWTVVYHALTTTSGTMTAYLWNTVKPALYTRIRASGTWFAWNELSEQYPVFVGAAEDLNALPASPPRPVTYQLSNTPTDWLAQHYPAPVPGTMLSTPINVNKATQVFTEYGGRNRQWTRAWGNTLGFLPWAPVNGDSLGEARTRHQLMVDDLEVHAGGAIGTGGATPVALTWDDYPTDFRDKTLPLLEARSIPATLAAVAGWYEPGQEWLGAAGTTWAEIDAWPVEIACHSMTHGNAMDHVSLEREIIESAQLLRTSLPSKRIECFIQPSANYGNAFQNGDSLDAYANTEAGTMLLAHYAMVTGTRNPLGTYGVPRAGRPYQGLTRSWIDGGVTATQNRITALAGTGQGLIVGAHANRQDTAGYVSTADLTAFLDWLVAEQAAGRVRLMTLSEWAVADTRSPA